MSNFQAYSAYYDLLYRDKDYEAEAAYVAAAVRAAAPSARTILELGSGTGRHGRLLAAMGFEVHGVERSAEMVELAQTGGGFTCEVGDICQARVGRTFDAVISLFHVISYQTTNAALLAAFTTAASHLDAGGVFLFDVWHGPAVLTERPTERLKEVGDERRRVRRWARPTLDTNASTVLVHYDLEGEDLASGQTVRFEEDHLMRYLFPTEIDLLARLSGFEVLGSEAFLTGAAPSESTWGVGYSLRKVR